MNIYKREKYLRRLRGFFHDTEMIKVITGVRRCGKSCLMASIADELRESGIPDSQILFLDLDSKKYRKVKTPDQLDALIEEAGTGNGTIYVFIDEVQNVKGFEEVVNAYRTDGGYSIFITGSNSYLLSGELSTKLTGRYIELEMYPLSFDEYLGMKAFMGKPIQNNLTAEFDSYILEGGFPKALQYDSMEDKRTYTRSVISEIFEKDIRQRVKVRNKAVFESVQTYLLDNFGATTSLNNILKDLEKQGVHIKRETLNRYIKILQDAKILYRCNRFDLNPAVRWQGSRSTIWPTALSTSP
jgi:predicted AAA+ superfamily ATPase